MQQPPLPPPRPASRSAVAGAGTSDAELAEELRNATRQPPSEARQEAHPTAVLMARHWQSVHDYASIATPSTKAASLLATAAFSKGLEQLRRPGARIPNGTPTAPRPLLLVTARRIARTWALDDRVTALPDLQNPESGRAVPAELFSPAADRTLVARAFLALRETDQCLLWHAEVEGEAISVPAGLLAMDPGTAAVQLEQGRELLRAGVLRSHLELAPDGECRGYHRLIDVALRRRRTFLPDVRAHLRACRHCRSTVEQLDHRGDRRGLLLAESLLGRAARPYVDSRPARRAADPGIPTPSRAVRGARRHKRAESTGPPASNGAYDPGGPSSPIAPVSLTGPGRSARRRRARRSRASLVTGFGLGVGLLLVATAVSRPWADEGSRANAGPGTWPSSVSAPGSIPVTDPAPPLNVRLRHIASGLCLDVRDRVPTAGAELVMAVCTKSAATQTWTYGDDDLLRSASAPGLCLDSRQLDAVPELSPCAGHSISPSNPGSPEASGTGGKTPGVDLRHDLTVRGHLLPGWSAGLALVPSAPDVGAVTVVKVRNGTPEQRWRAEDATSAAARGGRLGEPLPGVDGTTARALAPPSRTH
ncbi:ricin-type beta-trefoil lectin domain protein [Streptomyces sp. NPDC048057]|uniref:RICIN domain-containing protein n=1 Tax=Streptomyces sp. NPDC048057 TaxID=3155628 RepID=UPI0033CC58C8